VNVTRRAKEDRAEFEYVEIVKRSKGSLLLGGEWLTALFNLREIRVGGGRGAGRS